MLRTLRRARSKKSMKYFLILLTFVLSVGLVGSFAIWSLPSFQPSAGDKAREENVGYFERLEQDIKDYTEALQENPENSEILIKLANSQYDLGIRKLMEGKDTEQATTDIKEALKTYEKALAIQPDDIGLTIQTATTAFYAGDLIKAEDNYLKALELDSKSVEAKISYGQFLMFGKNDIGEAKKQWQNALTFATDDGTKQTLEALIKQAGEMEKLQSELEDETENE